MIRLVITNPNGSRDTEYFKNEDLLVAYLQDSNLSDPEVDQLLKDCEIVDRDGDAWSIWDPDEAEVDDEYEHNKQIADEVSRRCGGLTSSEYRDILRGD